MRVDAKHQRKSHQTNSAIKNVTPRLICGACDKWDKKRIQWLDEESGVVIVAPAGVLPMAGLLRNHLLEMFRAGIEKKRRTKIANQLLKFIKSPEFKNPIEEVVRTAESLKDGVEVWVECQ